MPNDLPELRASHEDRNRVVEAVQVAGGDGRLSAEELETRVENALSTRTLGEPDVLTADLPPVASAVKGVLVVEQQGGRYVRDGRWPAGTHRTRHETGPGHPDFTQAVITSKVLRIEAETAHGKLIIVGAPGIVIDPDGLTLSYSKPKLVSGNAESDPRLRIELVGRLCFAKVIEKQG